MDYSDRVNSKKGAGAVADRHETNAQTKLRIKELLTSKVLDLDKDPYVYRNHLGQLECRLCLTAHANEASYISHLSGRKHSMNLERRRVIAERSQGVKKNIVDTSVSTTAKRSWRKAGRAEFQITKLRKKETLQLGILLQAQLPLITVKEPYFCFMSYYELSQKNKQDCVLFLKLRKLDYEDQEAVDPSKWQYLVLSAEPYENVAVAFPAAKRLEKPSDDTQTESFWWYWDTDTREFFLQVLFK